ncbi:hypothetical protein D3C87_1301650 [compost metagenome]
MIEAFEKPANCRVQFSEREELAVTQRRQDPAFDHLHADFDLGFVLGFARASGQHGHAIVLGQVTITGVDVGLVAMRLGDAAAQIIGHQDLRCAAEKGKTAGVRAQPVGQFLRPGGLGKGVAGRAENGDEDLRLADLAGSPINDRHGLAGIIDKQLFAGTMFLTHDHVDLGGPEAVVLAEPAVLEALRMGESVLLPEQGQGYAGAAQLSMRPCPIRHRTLIAWNRRCWREQTSLQFGVRQRRRPSQPASVETVQVIAGTAAADAQAGGNFAHGQAGVEL